MSNYTRWYRDGSLDATNGSKTVTGHSTYWATAGLNPGDIVKINGVDYELDSVLSNTQLTLKTAYSGANLSKAAYAIVRNFTATPTSKIAAQVSKLLGDFERYIDTDMQKLTGKSAYQIAKDNGYTGTEAQWVQDIQTGGGYSALNQRTDILTYNNTGAHNSLYRGKELVFNSAVSDAIQAGTFKDIYIGDYFNFTDVAYSYKDEAGKTQSDTFSGKIRIADLDYFLRSGDGDRLLTHHAVIVPDDPMFRAGMNDTDTTEGGYVGSKMRTVHLKRAEAIFKACFGAGHILSHREDLVNAVTNGKPSGSAWVDSTVEIMDERQVYGALMFTSGTLDGTSIPHLDTVACKQFNLFRKHPDFICRNWIWLRNIVTSMCFAAVSSHGQCSYNIASDNAHVLPYALLY